MLRPWERRRRLYNIVDFFWGILRNLEHVFVFLFLKYFEIFEAFFGALIVDIAMASYATTDRRHLRLAQRRTTAVCKHSQVLRADTSTATLMWHSPIMCVWGSCIYMLDFHVVFCFFIFLHFFSGFEIFWDILRYFEIFWDFLRYFELLRFFEIFWDILRFFEIFWDILRYFEIFWDIFKNYFEIFWDILRYFEIFWDILRYFEIFWAFLRYFQKKKLKNDFFFGRSPIRFFQVFN